MDESALQLSLVIERVSGGLRDLTVHRLYERDPSLAARYGAAWREKWAAEAMLRVRVLAQAIAVQRPEVLAHHLTWARVAGGARDVAADELELMLACLRDVIAEELPDDTANVCLRCLDEAIANRPEEPAATTSQLNSAAPHYELLLRFLEALLDGRPCDAERIVMDAAVGGAPAAQLYRNVLEPALREIGVLWLVGDSTVADEHLSTATVERVMSLLRHHFPSASRNGRLMMATSASGDLHAVGVRMVADFFEMDGWRTLVLGANMPAPEIVTALRVKPVDLLAASVSSPLHLRELGGMIDAIRAVPDLTATKIIVGGGPLNTVRDLWKDLGADGSATNAVDAVTLGNRLVTACSNGSGGSLPDPR